MKQIIVYDESTGRILTVVKKSTDQVDVAAGTGVLNGAFLTGIQITSGDLASVAHGDRVNILYDAKQQMASRRIKKDAEGKVVLGPMGFPVSEEYFIDQTWKDFIDGVVLSIGQDSLKIDRTADNTSASRASFRVMKEVAASSYTEEEAAKVAEDIGAQGAATLRIDSLVEINPGEWKVDLDSGHLVKVDQITYE